MTQRPIDRRNALIRLLALGAAPFILAHRRTGAEVVKEIHHLEPGEYTWHPERSPKGAVAVVVSLPEQLTHVYRNGVRIAVSTCSTGKPGHETPTGVFVVLEKDKHHHSSTYNNASMPDMNRLTWDGVALHAGGLPGYPSSHGCVHLPLRFSDKLWPLTHVGTPVIIAGTHSDPWELVHPGLLLGGYAQHEFERAVASLSGKRHPSDWEAPAEYPVTTVIASSADRKLELIENGEVVAEGRLAGTAGKLGSHVLVLDGAHAESKGLSWHAISHHDVPGAELVTGSGAAASLITRLTADRTFQRAVERSLHPGLVMVVTDNPLHPDRRSGKDFVIMGSA